MIINGHSLEILQPTLYPAVIHDNSVWFKSPEDEKLYCLLFELLACADCANRTDDSEVVICRYLKTKKEKNEIYCLWAESLFLKLLTFMYLPVGKTSTTSQEKTILSTSDTAVFVAVSEKW